MDLGLGAATTKITRYRLGMNLAKAGLKESLHRFIDSVDCEDARLTIIFTSVVAKFEFEHSKEQILSRCREFYKAHSKEFKELGFVPTRIETKVKEAKDNIVFDPFSKPTPRNARKKIATSGFENQAKDPTVFAGFEKIRAIIQKQEMEQNL
ncbi:hypothetical protein CIG2463D_1005 [Campylobacter iguaniorum]|uniref:hypothetical protein n=1 Tax=Campylobacter iguaniorum TaxID=1244531 RepID=UPI00073A24DC|nr:hypothetical protein [Campylobacter iguaniorum]ALV24578.1 hypothetical protein CIG2463D_1005 [Campylobacter iguaniorum]